MGRSYPRQCGLFAGHSRRRCGASARRVRAAAFSRPSRVEILRYGLSARVSCERKRGPRSGERYSNTPRREIVDRRIEDFKSRKIDELRTRAVELVEAESEPGDCHRAESVQSAER